MRVFCFQGGGHVNIQSHAQNFHSSTSSGFEYMCRIKEVTGVWQVGVLGVHAVLTLVVLSGGYRSRCSRFDGPALCLQHRVLCECMSNMGVTDQQHPTNFESLEKQALQAFKIKAVKIMSGVVRAQVVELVLWIRRTHPSVVFVTVSELLQLKAQGWSREVWSDCLHYRSLPLVVCGVLSVCLFVRMCVVRARVSVSNILCSCDQYACAEQEPPQPCY
jgi:hypothetical protein